MTGELRFADGGWLLRCCDDLGFVVVLLSSFDVLAIVDGLDFLALFCTWGGILMSMRGVIFCEGFSQFCLRYSGKCDFGLDPDG